ncbi:DMT family transporter [Fuscibacter oryzae]|uniref:DMT family transporter n=1 Tax=Fuscibacter oryzae TaxID=2803939 RepID=A0A8J7SUI3_9RHOB|nr:DMT family transporter [Fuscibacter oryzae]MBL4926784.1 DMT family transporter [Fuscibacter oryzae]
MQHLWIAATLIAAIAQTGRNAAQAGLTKTIGTAAATQVRFLFGLPFALLFLALVAGFGPDAVPPLTLRAVGFTALGAVAQIGGTAMMLRLMQSQSFAVTTAWLKTEPVLLAIAAFAVLGDPLTLPTLLAIALATAGVVVMTLKPGAASRLAQARPAFAGLMAAFLFGLSAIGFRGGITALEQGGFLIRATTILCLSLALQTTILGLWMGLFDRRGLIASFRHWRGSVTAGFLGAFASQFWFIGFSLTSAANVRTLALIDLVFAQMVSAWVFHQPTSRRQMAGMALIVAGVAVLLRAEI